jgi:CRP/FNR family transcriptional regulator, nitrogen oxide reductase regulator
MTGDQAPTSPRPDKVPSTIRPAEQIVLMCASALFAGLSPRDCSEILSCARVRTFARDEMLFSQGQPTNKLVLIQSGSVKLTQLSSDGNEVILWMRGSGDALGVQNNASGCNHTCSAHAMEKCQALVWEYNHLHSLVARYPQIGANIGKILAGRLQELEERFREIATEKVAKRLALVLLRLLKSVGRQSTEGVELGLTREELAQMTGTTLFTISRILSKWAESGFVVPRREAVVIRDQNRLTAASEQDD